MNDVQVARQAEAFVRANPRVTLVPMTDELVDEATEIAAQLRLRAGDSIYVALARMNGARLVTWDREQIARSALVVEAASPADDLQDTA